LRINKKLVDCLVTAQYNPREDLQPGDVEYERLKKAIIEFDYIDPIIWNERTGRVVGGHQRLKILRELGYTEIDVSVVDLPEDKEKALNIALNKTGGDWDLPKLKDLLEELDTGDFDIEITGFGEDEIERLMAQVYPGDDEPDLGGSGSTYHEQYGVIVVCTDETDQERVYNRLISDGLKCKVVSV